MGSERTPRYPIESNLPKHLELGWQNYSYHISKCYPVRLWKGMLCVPRHWDLGCGMDTGDSLTKQSTFHWGMCVLAEYVNLCGDRKKTMKTHRWPVTFITKGGIGGRINREREENMLGLR